MQSIKKSAKKKKDLAAALRANLLRRKTPVKPDEQKKDDKNKP